MRGASSAAADANEDTNDRGDIASLAVRVRVKAVSSMLRLGLDCIALKGLAVLVVPRGLAVLADTRGLGLTFVSIGLTPLSLAVSKLLPPMLPFLTVSPKSNPAKFPARPSAIGLGLSRGSVSIVKLCLLGMWNVNVSRLAETFRITGDSQTSSLRATETAGLGRDIGPAVLGL